MSIPDTLGHNETVLLQRCPYFTGSLIHIYIPMGPQLPVLIMEVSTIAGLTVYEYANTKI